MEFWYKWTEDADFIELRMLIWSNWGRWFDQTEDSDLMELMNEDADLLDSRNEDADGDEMELWMLI